MDTVEADNPRLPVYYLRSFRFVAAAFIVVASGIISMATPVNRAGLERHYGPLLSKDLDRCTTCHLPSANKSPESLDEFPHNPFGDRLRAIGKQLAAAGKPKDIGTRLGMVAGEDSDGDGVDNETELLLGYNPGNAKDKPASWELAFVDPFRAELAKQLAGYQWRPFEPVTRPKVPRNKDRNWARNPIDSFIAAEREQRGLIARPEAPKEILLRRVYLDLIGLSPSPNEIAAFTADKSSDAYEKVVTRLLNDPRYGERWGRHWLDIWRYSDWAGWSGGNQIRDSKPHIWRWRDWTVEALNANKPYDQMIREMLAADELAPADTNALRATGFLVRNYKMLSREQWLEDTVKHTSQAFLGITMGCAKCHDHMYDPISQKDYYKFRAIFEPHQVRTDHVPGEVDTAKDGLVRTYDIGTNAPTYFFIRGDERKPDTNRVMTPGVPRSLGGEFNVSPTILPLVAAMPDKRPFVVEDAKRASERAVEKARETLAKATNGNAIAEQELAVAQAKHNALLAVLRAEEHEAKKGSAEWKDAAMAATKAQRVTAVEEAKLRLQQTEKVLAEAKEKAGEDKGAKTVIDSEKKRAEAEKAVQEARSKLDAEPSTAYAPRTTESYPEISTGRRAALAQWIANPRNPLTARVAMNHIWLRHFGQGLVPSPSDFGQNGKPPTHPALLDWLASEFVARDWSMKAMHRLIVTSATYRMASTPDMANAKIDPDNTYLWRMPSRRMEGELVRDNLLKLAGDLDETMGGPDIDNNEGLKSKRRSIYLRHAAEKEVEFLKIFDGPSVTECYMRHPTVVPQQALALANSELAIKESRALAAKLAAAKDTTEFVKQGFLQVLARDPKPEETKLCSEYLKEQEKQNSPERARQNLLLVLFNHNDFVTIR